MPDFPDNLLPASFRGIPFDVDPSVSMTTGRHIARHEYIERELSTTQDMGRRQREWPIDAFVFGDSYQSKHDALLEALETKGPGLLIHPVYGYRLVAVGAVSIEIEPGGLARFSITFVEHDEPPFPVVTRSPGAALTDAASTLKAASSADFGAFWDVAGAAFVAVQAAVSVRSLVKRLRESILSPLTAIAGAVGNVSRAMDVMSNAAESLVDTPGDVVTALDDILTAIGSFVPLEAIVPIVAAADATTEPTPDAQQAADNAVHLQRLVDRLALANAATQILDVNFDSYDAAASARDSLADGFVTASETAAGDVFDALTEARGAMVADVTEQAADLPRVRTYTVDRLMSSILLAWELYGDPDRAYEITERNNIAHPGFIPLGTISVLSE